MKAFLLFLTLLIGLAGQATVYHVASSGGNFSTISQVNAFAFSPGDQILFNRGEIFYGTLTINQSGLAGNPIIYGAYGTGTNPVITGFASVPDWTNLGSNIWESTNAISSLTTCDMVTINGVQYAMGRTPNSGWYTYQTFSTNVSITSTDVNSAVTNWTGADVVIKKAHWVIDRNPIIGHSGGTLTYSGGSFYNGLANYGFFIQNDVRTLDSQNEWYYNPSTKKIRIYSTSQPVNVKVATLNNLLTATDVSYFTIDGISFIGSNQNAVYLTKSTGDQYATIQNCSIDFSGRNAIAAHKSSHLTISGCTINHTNNTAINLDPTKASDTNSTYVTVSSNTITNTGLFEGFGDNENGVFIGINSTSPNFTCQYNSITNTGFNAISFMNNDQLIKNNFINYCNILKDDGGGIYTYIGNNSTTHTNRIVSGNIILNVTGNGSGTSDGGLKGHGVYLDGYSINVNVTSNTIAYAATSGVYLNGARNAKVRSNTIYSCADQIFCYNWGSTKMSGNEIKKNVMVSLNDAQRTLTFQALAADILTFGTSDSNYYATVFSERYPIHTVNASNITFTGTPYDLENWRATTSFDTHSTYTSKMRYGYSYTTIGLNKYANKTFDANVNGLGYANCTPTWTNSGGLDAGCVNVDNSGLSTNAIVQFPIGAIESGKTYLLKFSSKSSKANSVVRVNFTELSNPYASTTQTFTYLDNVRYENQMVLTSTLTHSNAAVMLQFSNADATINIDNFEVYEVSTTPVNQSNFIALAYNATATAATVSLPFPGIDMAGNRYGTSPVLPAYSSVVIVKDLTNPSGTLQPLGILGTGQVLGNPSTGQVFGKQ